MRRDDRISDAEIRTRCGHRSGRWKVRIRQDGTVERRALEGGGWSHLGDRDYWANAIREERLAYLESREVGEEVTSPETL